MLVVGPAVKLRERIRAKGVKGVGLLLGAVVLVIVVVALLVSGGSDESAGTVPAGGNANPAKTSTGNLFNLPGGPVGLGFGTEFRHESSLINPRTLNAQGITAPANIQSVDGERNVAAAFYQVDIPIIHNLTFTQAGRYDHYSDFGGAFSPSFALRFQPVQMLTTFASYSRGFRAPTLVENAQSAYLGHQNLTDPNDDNDAFSDRTDKYAVDSNNGSTTPIGTRHDWENEKKEPEPFHTVRIEPNSRLAQLAGGSEALVNSSHNQSVAVAGSKLKVVARTGDGVVEAVEWTGDGNWVMGVQWHPERMAQKDALAKALFGELVAAAKRAAAEK